MLTGIQKFLQFINDNWTAIVIIIALGVSIAIKVKNLFVKDKDGQIEIAKAQIKQIVLKLITDAEVDYNDWQKAGSIKRSQVIQKIYTDYPILRADYLSQKRNPDSFFVFFRCLSRNTIAAFVSSGLSPGPADPCGSSV